MFATRPRPVPRATRPRIYLQVSPHHLDDPKQVGAILRAEGAKFVTLVHDVIPLSHPEFARPQGAEEHLRRVRSIDAFAHGIIGNSQATIDALAPHMRRGLEGRAIRVAHFGADAPDIFGAPREDVPDRPYFVYISTIEPRKNHLLLLNIWRRLIETMGDDAPMLVLIGRRGWENENVIDMLERGEVLRGHVIEAGAVSDNRMQALLAHARAMLMPSFIEGFARSASEVRILPQIDGPQRAISTMALCVSVFQRPITVSGDAAAPASRAVAINRDIFYPLLVSVGVPHAYGHRISRQTADVTATLLPYTAAIGPD